MKLEAKARSVQISKLILGGQEINSEEDLIYNFVLNEILILDSKFLSWINRQSGMGYKATEAHKILSNKKVSTAEKKLQLIKVFFPKCKEKDAKEILFYWLRLGVSNIAMLKCVAEIIEPDEHFLRYLLYRHRDNKEEVIELAKHFYLSARDQELISICGDFIERETSNPTQIFRNILLKDLEN